MTVSDEKKLLLKLIAEGGETASRVLMESSRDNLVADGLMRELFQNKLGSGLSLGELIAAVEQDPLREALLDRPLTWFLPDRLLADDAALAGARNRSSTATIDRVKQSIFGHLQDHAGERFRKSQLIEELGLEKARVETALKQLKAEDRVATEGERATMVYFSPIAPA